ncbi:hypothetical protein L6452_44666 [Arctium lappa]|uniref:Uncharacterized protein n=1 Tax=Arctium lappa TaxID=4217 RepID=A0ACB8XGB9_ARCLA|nr:hypothetical protein L6452_44666 [Arctium lappa]
MGACVSIHHKASAMKVQVSFDSSKPDHKLVIQSSPISGKLPTMINGHVAVKPQLPPSQSPAAFSNYGSKEETFFDSQAWLDSDYEDDFMSVNGEFTPSRGNTPVHHSLIVGTPQFNAGAIAIPSDNNEVLGSTLEPSPTPTEKKMRLLDLFKESLRENLESNEEFGEPPKKDGEMGLNEDGSKPKRGAPVGSMQGCFSTLLSVRSSGRQKKKSPIPVVGL